MDVAFEAQGERADTVPTQSHQNQCVGDGSDVTQSEPPHQPERYEKARSGCEGSVDDPNGEESKSSYPKRCASDRP